MKSTRETWATYSKDGIIATDDELLGMLSEVVDTIHSLEIIYDRRADIVVSSLIQAWHALDIIAQARKLEHNFTPHRQ